jgi:hypothetical protein
MRIQHLERNDFLENYFDYRPGQHLGLIGPTQSAGKTTLAFQLLEHAPSWIPAEVLVMKPRDHVVAENAARLGYRETPDWPAPWWPPWQRNNRHVVWPGHTFDPAKDNAHMAQVFRRAILSRYKTGDGITFADELYGLSVELGLFTETEAMLTRGGGMGAGLWYATQKPSGTARGGITTFAYNSPTHMFLSRDPVKANTQRFAELQCGVDPGEIEYYTSHLPRYHWLYINREGPYLATIGAQ